VGFPAFWRTPPAGPAVGARPTGRKATMAFQWGARLLGRGRSGANHFRLLPKPPPYIDAGPGVPAPVGTMPINVPGVWVLQRFAVYPLAARLSGWRAPARLGPGARPTTTGRRPAYLYCDGLTGTIRWPVGGPAVSRPATSRPGPCSAPGFTWTPTYALSLDYLNGALFVRKRLWLVLVRQLLRPELPGARASRRGSITGSVASPNDPLLAY